MTHIKDILVRNKTSINIDDGTTYKQVTIRMNYKGVTLRGVKKGVEIGTKKQFVVSTGQFILSRIDARNGAFGIVPNELQGAIVTNDFLAFDINEAIVDREFFNLYLQSPAFLEACIKASKGNTNRKRVDENFFLNYEIALPPLSEQKKIINKVGFCKSNIELIDKEIALKKRQLEGLRNSIFAEGIEGRLSTQWRNLSSTMDSKDQIVSKIKLEKKAIFGAKNSEFREVDSPSFALPDGWVLCRLGDLGVSMRGKSPQYDEESDVLCINQKCVRWDYIDLEYAKKISIIQYQQFQESLLTEIDDLLINSTGEGTIGRAALVDANSAGFIFDTHVLKFRVFSKDLSLPAYLLRVINSTFGQKQIHSLKGAQTTKQTELGTNNLNALIIPLPPIEEQRVIVKKANSLIRLNKNLDHEINRANKITENLLHSVLNHVFH